MVVQGPGGVVSPPGAILERDVLGAGVTSLARERRAVVFLSFFPRLSLPGQHEPSPFHAALT